MDNPEKLAASGTQDEEKQNKAQHNKCRRPLYVNKQEKRKWNSCNMNDYE